MKSLKILLFGFVFSLFAFSCYSSASDVFVKKCSGYSAFSLPMNVSEYNISFSGSRDGAGFDLRYGSTVVCSVSMNNGVVSNGCSSVESSGPFDFGYNAHCRNEGNGYIIFTPKPYTPLNEIGVVINGLKNGINEFIPYVVYVGLGVLGVLIGFFAIKRLVNYARRGSLGIFRFKRRK